MKTYAVRKKLRTPVHFQFCYFCDGTLANGIVRDLSETGGVRRENAPWLSALK